MQIDEYDMALSNEDLFMLIALGIVFIFSIVDISLAWISFLVSGLLVAAWGFVRFRRRPLPKQVHYKKNIYLLVIKVIRNSNIFAIIFFDFLILIRYIPLTEGLQLTPIVFNFISLFIVSLLELVGNVTASDSMEFFPKIESETEEDLNKKKKEILFGNRFWLWISLTSLISFGLYYLIIFSVLESNDAVIISLQFVSMLLAILVYLFFFKRVMDFENLKSASMTMKAAEYYNNIDFKERSFNLLEGYLEKNENIAIMSKLALMYVTENEYDRALILTDKILKETEEKNVNVPHMISKSYLVRALCFKAKEQFETAYKEINKSLKYTPDNNVARKLRRDIRKIIKTKKLEKS